jgi:hypothetical protein
MALADRINEGDAARSWAKVGSSVVNAVRTVEFDGELPRFDEGTLAMLRVTLPELACPRGAVRSSHATV